MKNNMYAIRLSDKEKQHLDWISKKMGVKKSQVLCRLLSDAMTKDGLARLDLLVNKCPVCGKKLIEEEQAHEPG